MILRALNRLLGGVGFELSRVGRQGFTAAHLRRFGFAPRTLVDVGVGPGTPPLYDAFPEAHLVLVEALSEYEDDLRRILAARDGAYHLSALGSAEGRQTIHIEPGNRMKSSLLPRTALTETGDSLTTREIPVTTLDRLLEAQRFEPPFGLKIDTEGFELEVIRGAERFVRDAIFVIAEASVAERFEGGYRFAELVGEMAGHGFQVCDFLEVSRSSRAPEPRYVDVLFRRGAAGADGS